MLPACYRAAVRGSVLSLVARSLWQASLLVKPREPPMNTLHYISLFLDGLLVAAALVTYLARPRIGGQLAKGLRIILIGVMILGLAHLVETVLLETGVVSLDVNEVIHRALVVTGYVFVIAGFFVMRRAFEE